jgi:hypothetical protein
MAPRKKGAKADKADDLGTVTRADIEAKLKQIKGEADETVEEAKPYALMAAFAGVVVVILLAYLLGRRKGKKKTTVVEIRRV